MKFRVRQFLHSGTAPVTALAVAMVLLGCFFRAYAFGYPSSFQFDEHHFVENARNYLKHAPDDNDHPPLGKLAIAASITALGDHAVAWRFPSLCFGVATVFLGAVAAGRLFGTSLAGLIAAGLLSVDGFLIAYSRAALLDGALAMFAVASVVVATWRTTKWVVLVGGAVAGAAMATKFSGLGSLAAPLVAIAVRFERRRHRWMDAGLLLGIAGAVYLAVYVVGLAVAGRSPSPFMAVSESWRLVRHHAALTDMTNQLSSTWITWAIPLRPVTIGFSDEGDRLRVLKALGNVATWWAAVAVAIAVVATFLYRGMAWAIRPRGPQEQGGGTVQRFVATYRPSLLISMAGAMAFLAPWIVSRRDSYIYHFLPTYAVMVVVLGGFVSWVASGVAASARPWAVSFLALVIVVAGFYGPLWCYLPISEGALMTRLILPTWR